MRILIVDDQEPLRSLVKAYLRRFGFVQGIAEASDGSQALHMMNVARISGMPYELIISDWNMPNMDGLELLKEVRKVPGWEREKLPFLIVTTENEKGKVLEAIKSGATNYLVKPIDEGSLREKIKSVIALPS